MADERETSACRSCGAAVLFVPSATTGKLMILDAVPSAAGNVVIEDGRARVVRKGELFSDADFGGPVYMPHHATCPSVAEWRKTK